MSSAHRSTAHRSTAHRRTAHHRAKAIAPRQKRIFFESFARLGIVAVAATEAGFSRASAYRLKLEDPDFARAWSEAEIEAADRLEAEAHRRAVDGVERYVVSAGRVVAIDGEPLIEKHYSDALLTLLLKARRPDRFAERRQLTGRDGGPIRTVALADLSEADLIALASEDAPDPGADDTTPGCASPPGDEGEG